MRAGVIEKRIQHLELSRRKWQSRSEQLAQNVSGRKEELKKERAKFHECLIAQRNVSKESHCPRVSVLAYRLEEIKTRASRMEQQKHELQGVFSKFLSSSRSQEKEGRLLEKLKAKASEMQSKEIEEGFEQDLDRILQCSMLMKAPGLRSHENTSSRMRVPFEERSDLAFEGGSEKVTLAPGRVLGFCSDIALSLDSSEKPQHVQQWREAQRAFEQAFPDGRIQVFEMWKQGTQQGLACDVQDLFGRKYQLQVERQDGGRLSLFIYPLQKMRHEELSSQRRKILEALQERGLFAEEVRLRTERQFFVDKERQEVEGDVLQV